MSPGLAEVVNGDDVGMVEPGQGAGFAFEALGKSRVASFFAAEEFSAPRTGQAWLAGLVNRAHAALAQQFDDFELGKKPGHLLNGWGHKG